MAYSGNNIGRAGAMDTQLDTRLRRAQAHKDTVLEEQAVKLHDFNRRRTELFNHEVMSDRVMDIMLTALIACEQGTVLTRTAVAMANRMHLSEAESIINDLVNARFMQRGEGRDHTRLTDHGHKLMQEYVRRAIATTSLPDR